MSKAKIPVYDICSLSRDHQHHDELLVERFNGYLNRHSKSLHQPHRHSFFHLVMFTNGAGYHTIDFTRFPVKPFQVYFMNPGQVHSWHFEGEVDGFIVNFSESFFRSFLLNPHYLERFSFFQGVSGESVCQIPVALHQKMVRIFEEMLEPVPRDSDLLKVLLLQFFSLTEQECKSKNTKKVPMQKQVLLRNFRKLIDQHYRSIKLPKQYADLLYVTPNHLNALCQDLLGKTAGDLIRDRVILEAKRLLTNADMTITEIAYNLNFQDNAYFNRFFKKYVGMTPDEFRKQMIIY